MSLGSILAPPVIRFGDIGTPGFGWINTRGIREIPTPFLGNEPTPGFTPSLASDIYDLLVQKYSPQSRAWIQLVRSLPENPDLHPLVQLLVGVVSAGVFVHSLIDIKEGLTTK